MKITERITCGSSTALEGARTTRSIEGFGIGGRDISRDLELTGRAEYCHRGKQLRLADQAVRLGYNFVSQQAQGG